MVAHSAASNDKTARGKLRGVHSRVVGDAVVDALVYVKPKLGGSGVLGYIDRRLVVLSLNCWDTMAERLKCRRRNVGIRWPEMKGEIADA
jgi:hypothetical protein